MKNLVMISYLNRIKRILIVVFWIILVLYLFLKFSTVNISDGIFDLLAITVLSLNVGIQGIKSAAAYEVDRDFYKRPTWLLTVYLLVSLMGFYFCFEILEIMPGLIRINLYVSVILFFLYPIFLKIRK